MPMPPCLIPIERYDWVRFGFCEGVAQGSY
jgi:hypothetical protein